MGEHACVENIMLILILYEICGNVFFRINYTHVYMYIYICIHMNIVIFMYTICRAMTRPPRPSSTAECLCLIARLRGEQASAASWEPRPPFEAAEMDLLAAWQAWKASANQCPATSVARSAAANQRPSRHSVREMLTFKRR